MLELRKWLLAALMLLAIGSTLVVREFVVSPAQAADPKIVGDHWRNFDGHWSYWHEGDKRWYYTDGTHWYYHNGTGWVLYEFDKLFGLTGFHRGDYRVPVERTKIVLPRHDVFKHR
jgi:hypothetical protein